MPRDKWDVKISIKYLIIVNSDVDVDVDVDGSENKVGRKEKKWNEHT